MLEVRHEWTRKTYRFKEASIRAGFNAFARIVVILISLDLIDTWQVDVHTLTVLCTHYLLVSTKYEWWFSDSFHSVRLHHTQSSYCQLLFIVSLFWLKTVFWKPVYCSGEWKTDRPLWVETRKAITEDGVNRISLCLELQWCRVRNSIDRFGNIFKSSFYLSPFHKDMPIKPAGLSSVVGKKLVLQGFTLCSHKLLNLRNRMETV